LRREALLLADAIAQEPEKEGARRHIFDENAQIATLGANEWDERHKPTLKVGEALLQLGALYHSEGEGGERLTRPLTERIVHLSRARDRERRWTELCDV
jgi:hypothetical protein